MIPISQRKIRRLQENILSWWKEHKRDLPWRRTRDPYQIFLSEVMLQQTQVNRVIDTYLRFLTAYPTVSSLSLADTGDVLRLWKGMGYNRRAVYLKRAAQQIVLNYQGIFPKNEQHLLTLSGVGKYTARAILVFAYECDIPLVDTNIRQIITYYFFDGQKQSEKIIWDIAALLLPIGRSWEWHQALMDYGALAMPRLRLHVPSPNPPGKHLPFKESRRYFRGRVIDELRNSSHQKLILLGLLAHKYSKSQDFFEDILRDLEKEQLCIQLNGVISLPS